MALRWIHLSDFHFDTKDPYERNTVLEPLLVEITRRREQGFQPDALFVTGDIAYSGKPAEYDAATRFFDDLLEAAGLDKPRLFVVPGNHDLDKSAGAGLQRTLTSEQESVAYFAEDSPLYHFHKFQAFRAWFDAYFHGIRTCPNDNTCHPPEVFTADGLSIAVLPINTALFSLPDKQDHTALWIGRRKLDAMAKAVESKKPAVTFALLHHPIDWLHDVERSQIKTLLQKRADFILRGHLHKNEVDLVINTHGACLHLAAGACYQARQYPQTALFCKADLDQRELEVVPIHYVDDPEPKWTLDTRLFDPPDYVGRFPIPTKILAKDSKPIGKTTQSSKGNKTKTQSKPRLIEEVSGSPSRVDSPSKTESEEKVPITPPPELLEAIIAILEESDAATKELAKHFKLDYKTMDDCRDHVARKAIDSDLRCFFETALQVKAALRDSKPPDARGMAVMADFIQAVLPARYPETGLDPDRNKMGDNRDSPLQLLASHKTIAEIYMARRDRRATQFVIDVDGKLPGGYGLIAYDEGNLERGRDPNWEQFERDVIKALVEKFESKFGPEWKDINGESFINSFSTLDKNKSEDSMRWLREMIGDVLDVKSKQRASEQHHKGCDFTFYFLIETPDFMDEESKDRQNSVLQRLHDGLFAKIAFLRLAPRTQHSKKELVPYLHLHALLNPN